VGRYLLKGTQVCVQGALQTRSYEKDGQTHKATEVRVRDFGGLVLLGDKPKGGTSGRTVVSEDDVPF